MPAIGWLLIQWLWCWAKLDALSVCTPVDSIFILSSELVQQSQESVAPFFHDLIYEASSELSGVGALAFGNVADGFSNPLLGLTETIGANTDKSMEVIATELAVDVLMDDEAAGFIPLSEAIESAHRLFESENAGHEMEALFVVDLDGDDGSGDRLAQCVDAKAHVELDGDYVEGLYFVKVDEHFDVIEIFDCFAENEVFDEDKDAILTLYDLTCPSKYQAQGESDSLTLSKRVQFIEPGSITSCDLIPIESARRESMTLDPASTITVIDDSNDDMSYEVGYTLMATQNVLLLLPAECTVPVFKIESIHILDETTKSHEDGEEYTMRTLQLGVSYPESVFTYLTAADVSGEDAEDSPTFMKPEQDVVAPEIVQEARDMVIAQRRRRRMILDLIGDVIEVVDSQKMIDELVEELVGSINANFDIGELDLDNLLDLGLDLPCDFSGCSFTHTVSESDSFSKTFGGVTATANLSFDAELSVNLGVHVIGPEFDVAWTGLKPTDVSLKKLGMKLYGDATLRAEASANASGSFAFDKEFYKGSLEKLLTSAPVVQYIQFVPMVFWPRLEFSVKGEVDSPVLEVSAKYEYVWSMNWAIGAQWIDGNWDLLKEFETTESAPLIPQNADQLMAHLDQLDVDVTIPCPTQMPFKFSIPVTIGVDLFFMVYPSITFTPSLLGDVFILYDCNTTPCNGMPNGALMESRFNLAAEARCGIELLGSRFNAIEYGWDLVNIDLPDLKKCDDDSVIPAPTPAPQGFHWTVGGYGGTGVTAECVSDSSSEATLKDPQNSYNIAVSCCSLDGTEGFRNKDNGCWLGKTFDEAVQICDAEGMRLCTIAEMEADVTKGKGCQNDNRHNWVSDECDHVCHTATTTGFGNDIYNGEWVEYGTCNGKVSYKHVDRNLYLFRNKWNSATWISASYCGSSVVYWYLWSAVSSWTSHSGSVSGSLQYQSFCDAEDGAFEPVFGHGAWSGPDIHPDDDYIIVMTAPSLWVMAVITLCVVLFAVMTAILCRYLCGRTKYTTHQKVVLFSDGELEAESLKVDSF